MSKKMTRRFAILIQEKAEHFKQPLLADLFDFDGDYDGLQARICGIADGYLAAEHKGERVDCRKVKDPSDIEKEVMETDREFGCWSIDLAHISLNRGSNFIWVYLANVR